MRFLNNKRGSALVPTIILLMIVTVLGVAMLVSVASEIQLNRAMEEKIIARYLAQAGIEHGLYLVENEYESLDFPHEEEVELGGRNRVYGIVIDEIGTDITIKATGKIEAGGKVKEQVALEAMIQEDGKVVIVE